MRFTDKVKLYITTRGQVRTQSVPIPLSEPEEPENPVTESVAELPVESTAPILPETLRILFEKGYEEDPMPKSVLQALREEHERHPQITLAECQQRGPYLFYRERLFIPDYANLKAELLRAYYKSPTTSHSGRLKTYELLSRDYYWPGMYSFVKQWVQNCHTCRRSTLSREAR